MADKLYFFCIYLLLAASGCSNINSSMSNINTETPHDALTNLTETVKCVGKKLSESESSPVLFLVDDFFDGTVPIITDSKALIISSMRDNGPLADAGKYDFEAIIKRSVYNKKIVIPYSLPNGLIRENVYGRLDKKYLLELAKIYGVTGIIRIKGVFTQNDSEDYHSKGFGNNAEVDGKHGSAEIEYGKAESSKSLSLTVHVGNAMDNTIVAATTLTLNTHTKSNEFSVGFGAGEGGVSFAREEKLNEAMHGAQRTLVEAAALWVLRGLYGEKIDFNGCLGESGPSPNETVSAYQIWLELDKLTRIRYLKLMLRKLNYYFGEINYDYSAELQDAITCFEEENGLLIPHTENNLGDLFILLYHRVDFDQIRSIEEKGKKPLLKNVSLKGKKEGKV
ncbi:MAG: hypothetical protein WGN25_16985 [Candidatus Electrothrix sp. GW3-4]|uniref:hypothetical protein n=1 Tax=Candidatus Electrothrix sp. GW3-4 TaxID=3126740 RepID=UPI0030CB6CA5